MVDDASVVLVMTKTQAYTVESRFGGARGKVYLVTQLTGHQQDIVDPYGLPLAAYRRTADTLQHHIHRGYYSLLRLAARKD
jgi:protein-tyrosine-phosphatase